MYVLSRDREDTQRVLRMTLGINTGGFLQDYVATATIRLFPPWCDLVVSIAST